MKSKTINKADRRATLTAFMLIFPGAIAAGIATFTATLGLAAVAILMFFYQAVIIKNYIESHQT